MRGRHLSILSLLINMLIYTLCVETREMVEASSGSFGREVGEGRSLPKSKQKRSQI